MAETEQEIRDPGSSGLIGRLSIRRKLLTLVMLVSSCALVLVSVAFVLYQQYTFRQRVVKDITTQAKMLAENCIGALSFRDQKDAQEVLHSLRAKPDIAYAALYQENDEVLRLIDLMQEELRGQSRPQRLKRLRQIFDEGFTGSPATE